MLHERNCIILHFQHKRVAAPGAACRLHGKLQFLGNAAFVERQIHIVAPIQLFQNQNLFSGFRLTGGGEDVGRIGKA